MQTINFLECQNIYLKQLHFLNSFPFIVSNPVNIYHLQTKEIAQ